MIENYVSDLAAEMKIPVTEVSIQNVSPIAGYRDAHLLKLWYGGYIATTLVWKLELDRLQSGLDCDLLETKVRMALKKLHVRIAPNIPQMNDTHPLLI